MCGECGNQYDKESDEDWVRCKGCKQWYHTECLDLSEGAGAERYFVFDTCPLCPALANEPESETQEESDQESEETDDSEQQWLNHSCTLFCIMYQLLQ